MESLSDLLSRHSHRIWTGKQHRSIGPQISTGYPALDALLGGGWPVGTLVEIMSLGSGLGKATLLLPALATLTQAGKAVAWLPADERPYAPTLLQAGIELSHMLITSTQDHHQRLWGAERCLRSDSCGAVILSETRTIADPMLRRLKLAAAAGNTIGFVLRSETAARTPSPASVRIRVRSAPFALQQREVTVLKCGGHPPRSIVLDLDARGR